MLAWALYRRLIEMNGVPPVIGRIDLAYDSLDVRSTGDDRLVLTGYTGKPGTPPTTNSHARELGRNSGETPARRPPIQMLPLPRMRSEHPANNGGSFGQTAQRSRGGDGEATLCRYPMPARLPTP